MYQNFNQIPNETGNLNINEDQFLHYFERVITDASAQVPSQSIAPLSNSVQKQIFQKQLSRNSQQQQLNQPQNTSGLIQGRDEYDNDGFNYRFANNNSINNNNGNNMVLQQPTPSSSTSSTVSSSATSSNNAVVIDSTTLAAFNRGVTADIGEPNLIQCQDENGSFTGEETLNVNLNSLGNTLSDISPSIDLEHEQDQKYNIESGNYEEITLPTSGIATSSKVGKVKKRKKKTSHNVIENKYRLNINDKISQLRDIVPTISVTYKELLKIPIEQQDIINLDGLEPTHKLNKGSILNKTIEYIKHLQKRCDEYKGRNELLEKYFVRCTELQQPPQMNGENSSINPEHEVAYHK
ncbi:hypothetical protein C6P45_003234 [Maudiozyma exigua]|uniref:BHLH domain-containing protein n=1 Tax=Maudiozyma exigua TaxID=34358 RepID=A0A9P6WBX7_MAUEX|nr:hypothetical protein C6P45_003234 [Kazachstania exigua]